MSNRDPDLADVIRNAMNKRIAEVHTHTVGKVEEFYKDTLTVDVRPFIDRLDRDPEGYTQENQYPVLPSVPVVFVGSSKKYIDYETLEKGDIGLLLFCESSIETWQSTGRQAVPSDFRKHHLSDGVFIVGLMDEPAAKNASGSLPDQGKLVGVRDDDAQALFQPGKISLGGEGSNDWVAHASRVEQRLTNIENALNQPTGTGMDGGAGYRLNITNYLNNTPSPSVASTLVALKD